MRKKIFTNLMLIMTLFFVSMSCSDTPDPEPPTPSKPDTKYDIEFTPKYALGVFYESDFMDGLCNFYMVLSDVAIEGDAEDFIPAGAGSLLAIDMYVKSPEEGILPSGTYKYTQAGADPFDFTFGEYTQIMQSDANGVVVKDNNIGFTEAELTVSSADGKYTIELSGTTTKGKTFHVKYTAAIAFEVIIIDIDDFFPPLTNNIQATYIDSRAYYYGKNKNGAGYYTIELFDYKYDGSLRSNALVLHLFSEIKNDREILMPGTYTVIAEYGASDTYQPGNIQPGYLNVETLQNQGTNLVHTVPSEDFKSYYGFATEGTVVVALSGDQYTMSINLKDKNGYTMTGTFLGALDVTDKSYYSNIESDVEPNMAGMPCEIEYYGAAYADQGLVAADSWGVYIGSWEDNTEAIQLELLAPKGSFANGLPEGNYMVSITYDPETPGLDYVCIPGEMHDGSRMFCSWYMAALQGGSAYEVAPFSEGAVAVTKKTNGEYTFKIEALDDAPDPNQIMCEWTGVPTFTDMTTEKVVKRAPKYAIGLKSLTAVNHGRKAQLSTILRTR